MERKIALCVSQWSADSTLYAWSYAKQYFLRVRSHVAAPCHVGSRLHEISLPGVLQITRFTCTTKDGG